MFVMMIVNATDDDDDNDEAENLVLMGYNNY